ncbi:AraC family transcriptional regulator [Burkholderia sp. MSh2]|uniref:AraC family transcriptional regulator n=2 Tax=Burkholderiaceae TaxID=119060 RepID=A0A6P2LDL8_9BURK|nr:AraC family transcriptional regulator [Burkholderia sp. MSh2]KFG98102.1 AraC family transcriptional regulator [Burkholderia paludis]CAB3753051.1 Transcriptional activator NphR [Burkholderia paludis]VWB65042.1 AraC family transcriptional regulator [Burkholderia paludis]
MTHEIVVGTSSSDTNLRDLITENFLPLLLRDTGPLFRMSVRFAASGGIRVADVDTSSIRVDRDRVLAERTDCDCYKILFQIAGQSRITQRNKTSTVNPGEWAVYDATQAYSIECADASRFVAALMPPRSSTMWRWFVDRADARVYRTVGNAHLALQAIQYLMDGRVPDDPESLFGFEQSTLMLLDSVVRREASGCLDKAAARSASLRMNAEIFLARHYSDPDLTPDRLAHALNVSRRTLYGALSATGQTPHGLIQEYRLQAGKRALEDPSDTNRNLLELAMMCGFSDMTHFGRLFKARFGCSPGAYRLASRNESYSG